MIDVIVSGAGPAGSIAALLLARAGARVWLLERERLPRPKLCGDTLNPGAVATLAGLGLVGGPLRSAVALEGMMITSPQVSVKGAYARGHVGFSLRRSPLDEWLTKAAVAAGARLECGVRVRDAVWRNDGPDPSRVSGVAVVGRAGQTIRIPAALTIAADGRRSVLARAAKLTSVPRTPRRWAFGVYASGVTGLSAMGEMHVRPGHYVGVNPMATGVANVCVVTDGPPTGQTPMDVIGQVLSQDRRLRSRASQWQAESEPVVLGPLAVDATQAGVPGLLLAGDAAGFVDPITGDGVHLAIRGGVLAATVALEALASGRIANAATELTARRATAFGRKQRFNRGIRRLVGSRLALSLAGVGARIAPRVLTKIVNIAGDVPVGERVA